MKKLKKTHKNNSIMISAFCFCGCGCECRYYEDFASERTDAKTYNNITDAM